MSGAQFKFPTQTFTVPGGFEVELVAGSPLVERPVSASFDQQGRLYVTDSSGSNEKPDKQLESRPHRVVRLEDTHGDGIFDKSVVFADKMMFPEGCLWFDGSVYVAAPPSIWKLTDTNNDGVADVRTEWHEGKTLTGCANDLHGPYLGPDGWIYWCKGAFAAQTYALPDGQTLTSRAAHIFRSRPDHSGLEPVLTGGMDNPVGLAFTPEGERILCGTFFVHPEAGKRDGLIHAIYGGVYGKPNEVTDNHIKTGGLMPVMTHLGPAAPCSVIRYQSEAFGKEYQDNLFVCDFNVHKITRHILEPEGATFRTLDTDFLVSDNPDFHPTDVIEDADGSLLVLDTGGWYKICCPTSQLSKPDVLGAIYRIRRITARKLNDPRGLKLAWNKLNAAELAKLLEDERPVVRKRAIEEFAKRGPSAIPALAKVLTTSRSTPGRINAIWALTRIADPQARASVRKALEDSEASVRHAAICSVSLWRDPIAADLLITLLQAESAANRRAIAEALGRIGRQSATEPLLDTIAASGPMDRVQEHSFFYALIELGDKQDLLHHAHSNNSALRRAALMALDQIRGSGLKPELIAPLLASPQPVLRETGSWIAGHHPDWGWALADYFRRRLTAEPDESDELKRQLAQFSRSDAIQELIALILNKEETPVATRQLLLEAIAASGLKEPPSSWAGAVTWCLAQTDENLLRSAVAAARAVSHAKGRTAKLSEALLQIAGDETHPAELRLDALAAMPNGLPSVEPGLLKFICANVDPSKPVLVRNAAAASLARAKLTDEQFVSIAETLKTAGPLETPKLLGAFEHSTNEAIGLALLAALRESKSRSALRPEVLKPLLAKYPPAVQEQGKDLLASLNVDAAKQSAHLEELLPTLKDGDIRRGQALFNSPRAACSSCHSMGYLGGKVGPDLTSIGQVRTERDLLEAIVYPSASFVRSFEPYIVTTRNGEEVSGVLRKDAPDEVELATGPGTEARIARADIAGIRPGTVSIMPAGLEEQLTRQELGDLIAFLKATKWGPK
jgi:putative membrane-bound dehydrogenase-like protein